MSSLSNRIVECHVIAAASQGDNLLPPLLAIVGVLVRIYRVLVVRRQERLEAGDVLVQHGLHRSRKLLWLNVLRAGLADWFGTTNTR